MIPATQFEKFMVSLLYVVVYFWTMMFVVYALGNILGTWLNNFLANIALLSDVFGIRQQNVQWIIFDYFKQISILTGTINNYILGIVISFLAVQSIFLLGSIYFKRNGLLKTCFAIAVISVFFFFLTIFEMKYFVIDSIAVKNKITIIFNNDGLFKIAKVTVGVFFYLLVPYLWLTSYIRLTEKEV